MGSIDDRVAALEATIAELQSRTTADSTTTDTRDAAALPVSRRHALRTAGALAAGAMAASVATTIASATPAAAAPLAPVTGNPAIHATADPTSGTAVYATSTAGYAVQGVSSSSAGVVGQSTSGTGVIGVSSTANGLSGASDTGDAVVGASAHATGGWFGGGLYGVAAQGSISALMLVPSGDPPPTRTTTMFQAGAITTDQYGATWQCVVSGTPGTWRQIVGPSTAGAFHPIAPHRVYDSRAQWPFKERISTGQNRRISVADGRDQNGVVTVHDLVPAGATAVFANVTVVDTKYSGWLAANPGGITTVSASSINWSADGQILANGLALTINTIDRTLTMVAGGPGSTDFVVDVNGYWR